MLLYEFLGTSGLTYAVLISGGYPLAVTMTLLIIIVVCEPVSGSHFNPAVSTGVYFWQGKWK